MERKGKFSRSPLPLTVCDTPVDGKHCGNVYMVENMNGNNWYGLHSNKNDAELCASAFNAATTCEDMGYDGEACVRALPELVKALEVFVGKNVCECDKDEDEFGNTPDTQWGEMCMWCKAEDILAQCRG